MKITERRIVQQHWFEDNYTKQGYVSHGWWFKDDSKNMYPDWSIVEHLKLDKHGNPILGIAEKETEIEL